MDLLLRFDVVTLIVPGLFVFAGWLCLVIVLFKVCCLFLILWLGIALFVCWLCLFNAVGCFGVVLIVCGYYYA